jgi:hypothetical protein
MTTFSLDVPSRKIVYLTDDQDTTTKRATITTNGGSGVRREIVKANNRDTDDVIVFISENASLAQNDKFVLVTANQTLEITLPPLGGAGVLKIEFHTSFANVTHIIKTSQHDAIMSRDGESKQSSRLGLDNKYHFVGFNNLWHIC